jgi:hypothetical protein
MKRNKMMRLKAQPLPIIFTNKIRKGIKIGCYDMIIVGTGKKVDSI